jgi:hypothetical protein
MVKLYFIGICCFHLHWRRKPRRCRHLVLWIIGVNLPAWHYILLLRWTSQFHAYCFTIRWGLHQVIQLGTSYSMGTRALSLEVKRLGREGDDSPKASVEVKKMWFYTSTPPYVFVWHKRGQLHPVQLGTCFFFWSSIRWALYCQYQSWKLVDGFCKDYSYNLIWARTILETSSASRIWMDARSDNRMLEYQSVHWLGVLSVNTDHSSHWHCWLPENILVASKYFFNFHCYNTSVQFSKIRYGM